MSVPGLPGWARFKEVVMGRRCNARLRSIVVLVRAAAAALLGDALQAAARVTPASLAATLGERSLETARRARGLGDGL